MIKFSDNLKQCDDYKSIVINSVPIIDVRAPIEFNKGSLPGAVNIPLLSDEHRAIVGTIYKESGQTAAIKKGLELVPEHVRRSYIKEIKAYLSEHPDAVIMCFRGGQRSSIVQQWLYDFENISIARINGGFKAIRNFLIKVLSSQNLNVPLYLIAGHTGAGKTLLLSKLDNVIDLERLANHRGSSFGGRVDPQPTQINFEHALAYRVLNLLNQGATYLVAEKEGKLVGKNRIPENFWNKMIEAKLVVLNAGMIDRVNITYDDYITRDIDDYVRVHGNNGMTLWRDKLLKSIGNLEKRLGRKRMLQVIDLFESAYNGDISLHKKWIELLLNDYYDPMYAYQRSKWVQDIVFEGDNASIIEYFNTLKSQTN